MADIPKDVMQAATECYKGLLTTCERWDDEDAANDIPAIAALILRERERCASMVENLYPMSDYGDEAKKKARFNIASIIRNE